MRLPAIALALIAVATAARADETSTTDKLRILYSSRFTFTDDGPAAGDGADRRRARPAHAVRARRPDRDPRRRRRQLDRRSTARPPGPSAPPTPRPAEIREWTVVERLGPDDPRRRHGGAGDVEGHGYHPRAFELGTLFAVDGEVIDTREVVVAIDPVDRGARARPAPSALADKHGSRPAVHAELVRRPRGTVVAQSGVARR
jgi:hypothetical protein